MTGTTPHQQHDGTNPAEPQRVTRYWRHARTPLLTASATAGVWLASGALQELGARLIAWLW